MATTSAHLSTNGATASTRVRRPGARRAPSGRRRQLPLVVVGVLLVLGGALAFAETALHLETREDVLVTTAALAAGQVLAPEDLRAVALAPTTGVALVPAVSEATVVGRPLAVPLVAGAFLSPGELGAASSVAAGSDTVALLLKPGGYPPDLATGDRVEVVPVAPAGSVSAPPATAPVAATVLGVAAAPESANGGSIVTLQVKDTSAASIAALGAAGEASVVEEGVG